ncbi:unnamed protein product, partial [Effrenium voratum]
EFMQDLKGLWEKNTDEETKRKAALLLGRAHTLLKGAQDQVQEMPSLDQLVQPALPQAKEMLKEAISGRGNLMNAMQGQQAANLAKKAVFAIDALRKSGMDQEAAEIAKKAEQRLGMSLNDLDIQAWTVAELTESRHYAPQRPVKPLGFWSASEPSRVDTHGPRKSCLRGHNLTLLAQELRFLGGNAFAQEYGAIPTKELLMQRMPSWVFVTTIRDPWSRFWSQLRHEMAGCLAHVKALAVCMAGNHHMLGWWWSPSAHIDSVLGVPGFRISESPHIYGDNYYTRVLLNRTDLSQPPLTLKDYEVAKSILFERMSAVIVVEDFARSALQLACSLGLDLDMARPLLRTRVRPYEHNEVMLEIPTESELGPADVTALRNRFVAKNRLDYGLYNEAKRISELRLARCARQHPAIAELRAAPVVQEDKKAVVAEPISIDEMFGCINGSLQESPSGYLLYCPRTVEQSRRSWWSPEGLPRRRPGQKLPGQHCWQEGFDFGICCGEQWGPEGNKECWDDIHNYTTCCIEPG